ncbi:hypothetical protein GCM10008015_10670 [Flavobacterium palustre]|uniref:SIR2-like domain-containing protein n=1 Tax=Flavobacterium palustre TaxID=1476463 RepID=A0ABQ1HEB2_9FLAO|nr:SIR2 family protein [Flavobacterium palustre]GGA71850.1 hypothetical protein GCM10008015_10670 [Flavobacterium palustre]
MSFKEDFFERLDGFSSSPFLFIGSGFSFKYINTETWEGLLRKYSGMMNIPFEKYRSLASGNWPKVGTLIANDYHGYWFDADAIKTEREKNLHEMVDFSSPLKVSISEYLKEVSKKEIDLRHKTDIELLKAAKINGIITTNYDLLCESIYPDFKVYKSQQELIFSSLQEIGEIYKIHGCCSEPNSLIITAEDYHEFEEKNAYLAAKLLTVFLEHPTIFMGYSISDTNVRGILASIIRCLDQGQVNELSSRLFFIEYVHDHKGEPLIDKYEFEIGGSILPLTRIRTKEYLEILQVLASLNQKFPASLLRKIKEHIYELVSTNDPSGKIAVVDFNTDTDLDKVDVVIGVGVSGKSTEKSYETFSRFDVAEDVVFDNKGFDAQELIDKSLPKLVKANGWMPVCKYYKQIENKSKIDAKIVAAATKDVTLWKDANPYSYKAKTIQETYNSIAEIIEQNTPDKAIKIMLLIEPAKLNLEELEKFLRENWNLTTDQNNKSYYMKLVCLYDRLKNQ